MEIRLATSQDVDRIIEITNACAKHMISQNIFQWNDKYPNREIFSEDILNECLDHEKSAVKAYYGLLENIDGKSIMLEEYARTMIATEEMHQAELKKMLRDNF